MTSEKAPGLPTGKNPAEKESEIKTIREKGKVRKEIEDAVANEVVRSSKDTLFIGLSEKGEKLVTGLWYDRKTGKGRETTFFKINHHRVKADPSLEEKWEKDAQKWKQKKPEEDKPFTGERILRTEDGIEAKGIEVSVFTLNGKPVQLIGKPVVYLTDSEEIFALETFGLVIPKDKLEVIKKRLENVGIYLDTQFIGFVGDEMFCWIYCRDLEHAHKKGIGCFEFDKQKGVLNLRIDELHRNSIQIIVEGLEICFRDVRLNEAQNRVVEIPHGLNFEFYGDVDLVAAPFREAQIPYHGFSSESREDGGGYASSFYEGSKGELTVDAKDINAAIKEGRIELTYDGEKAYFHVLASTIS